MKIFFEQIIKQAENKVPIAIATVIGHKGSVPRSSGTKMAVCGNGDIIGTIGGGLVESKTIEQAKQVLETQKSIIVDYDMTHTGLPKEKMICGGKLKILVQYLDPDIVGVLETLRQVVDAYVNRQKAVLIAQIDNVTPFRLMIKNQPPSSLSAFPIEPEILDSIENPVLIEADGDQFWCEPLQFSPTLYLFGGGHVSRAIAGISHTVDFETIVIDDRSEILQPDFFPAQSQLVLINDFEDCFNKLNIESGSYIVIVTRGHVYDMQVLKQALESKANYIGMMGSRRKRNTIYNHLKEQGIKQEQLDQVHSPIGIDINAESPAELAISIIGELIKTRRHQ